MSHIDHTANQLGRDQYGLVHRRQLVAAGVDRRAVTRRVEAGVWLEHRCVIELRTHPATWRQQVMLELLAAGPDVVASHLTAAHLWGLLDVRRPVHLDVLTLRTRDHCRSGMRIRSTRWLPDSDRDTVLGIPVTAAARTIADLAGEVPMWVLERIVLDAARRRLVTAEDLLAQVEARRRFRGRHRLRAAIAAIPPDPAKLESPLEVDGLRFLRWCQLTGFVLQHPIVDDDGSVISRADVAFLRRRVALFWDSAAWHDAESDAAADRIKRDRVEKAGWTVIVLRAADIRPPNRERTREELLRSLA